MNPPILESRQRADTAVAQRPAVRPLSLSSFRVVWTLYAIASSGALIGSLRGLAQGPWVTLSAFGGWFVLLVLIFAGAARRRRRTASRLLASLPPVPDLAEQCWLSGLAHGRGPQAFDARRWLEARPSGPRIIALGVDLPPPITPIDPAEEVDIGAGSGATSNERFGLIAVTLYFGLSVANKIWKNPQLALLFAPPCLLGLLYVAYRLGFRPIQLGALIAGPGVVRVSSFGRNQEFHRHDSVLVIWGVRSSRAEACLVHASGRAHRFDFADSAVNPRLQQLLARWSIDPTSPAAAPSAPPPLDPDAPTPRASS